MSKVLLLFTPIFLFAVSTVCGQNYSDPDKQIFKEKINLAEGKDLFNKPINEVIVEIGKSYLGSDYRAHTLEKEGMEKLVINLSEFDCTTYLENVLAIARCIKQNDTSFQNFKYELQYVRYRWGIIINYTSRLHYFSDWIHDNEFKSVVRDITKEIGGKKIKFELNYMTSHPEQYSQLVDDSEYVYVMKKIEEEISEREYYFIPKAKIEKIESKIESGDMIAFTSNIKGLDVNHVGIAVRIDDNHVHILHAPEPGTKVQITQLALPEYISKIKHDTGIIIFRAVEPLN